MPVKSVGRKAHLVEKFSSEENRVRFEQSVQMRVLSGEKGFEFKAEANLGVPPFVHSVIIRRQWEEFAKHPQPIISSLVQEFYANFPKESVDRVIMRRRAVYFNIDAINAIYGLPGGGDDFEEYLLTLEEPDWDGILARVCKPGTVWSKSVQGALTVNKASLTPEASVWYHFVTAKLLPSAHGKTASGDRVALLDAVIGSK